MTALRASFWGDSWISSTGRASRIALERDRAASDKPEKWRQDSGQKQTYRMDWMVLEKMISL